MATLSMEPSNLGDAHKPNRLLLTRTNNCLSNGHQGMVGQSRLEVAT
jgi:hypothetical protein